MKNLHTQPFADQKSTQQILYLFSYLKSFAIRLVERIFNHIQLKILKSTFTFLQSILACKKIMLTQLLLTCS